MFHHSFDFIHLIYNFHSGPITTESSLIVGRTWARVQHRTGVEKVKERGPETGRGGGGREKGECSRG